MKRVYYCQRCLNHRRVEPRRNHKAQCQYQDCACDDCSLVDRRRQLNVRLHNLESELVNSNAKGQEVVVSEQQATSPQAEVKKFGLEEEAAEEDDEETSDSMPELEAANNESLVEDDEKSSRRDSSSSNSFSGVSTMSHVIGKDALKERYPTCQKCGQHGIRIALKGHKKECRYKDCRCVKCSVIAERQKLMADQIKIRRRQKKDKVLTWTREQITATLNAIDSGAADTVGPDLTNAANLPTTTDLTPNDLGRQISALFSLFPIFSSQPTQNEQPLPTQLELPQPTAIGAGSENGGIFPMPEITALYHMMNAMGDMNQQQLFMAMLMAGSKQPK